MKTKVYEYSKCGTCRNAMQWLKDHNISCEVLPIREQPPTKAEIRRMLKIYGGNLRKLFNTSGLEYKALELKDNLDAMSEEEAVSLLAGSGMLVKRPFVLTSGGGVVGFKPSEWEKILK